MNIVKRLAAAVTAAGILSAAMTSCGLTTETYNINITVPLDDIDFTDGSCHGISFSSDINGTVVVTCDDVEEPEIRVRVDFGGGTKGSRKAERRKLERDSLTVTHELNDEGLLVIDFKDKTTGQSAKSSYNPMKQEFSGVLFSHADSCVEMTLPRSFDSFNISNYGGDIAAKELCGHVELYTYDTLTAENIAFNADDENMAVGEKGVIISTARYKGKRADALIMSRDGDIVCVLPEPADLTGRSKADTIQILCSGGTVTVDLNGSECGDTYQVDKEKNRQYDYSVAHGAALLDIEAYGNGVTFTNGTYKPDRD
ncbi:MAG: hypothetical protein IKP78_05580 [Ruminococcus sp.]|nr:hypothetical protein [Ruminococcus sp.]